MPRPFRYEPPIPRPGLVPRVRLLEALRERWSRRLVTVVAGPGFGKTVLLVHALLDNRERRAGADVWLSCEPADESAEHLAAGLSVGCGLGEAAGLSDLLAACWARAPEQLCLLVDDVHEVPPGSSGADVFARLLVELPANGHLVLASRQSVPLRTARIAASGELVHLGERDLLLTEAELAAFAAQRGVEPGILAASGGWPALAELAASAGTPQVSDYLWEEVVTRLGPERTAVLARLAAIGGADDEVLSSAVGRPVRVADHLVGVPLADTTRDGWAALHSLWEPVLRPVLAPDEATLARRRAAAVHRDRGRFSPAVDLFAESEAWDEVLAVMRQAVARWRAPVTPAELARWYRLLPPRLRTEPEAQLVDGIQQLSTRPRRAVARLEASANAFRARHDVDGELSAIAQLGLAHWWAADIHGLRALHERIAELASAGSTRAAVLRAIGVAGAANLRGDPTKVLSALDDLSDDVPDDWSVLVHWLRAAAHLRRGDTPAASSELDVAMSHPTGLFAASVEFLQLRVAWLEGRIDEVKRRLPGLVDRYERTGSRQNVVYARLRLAIMYAWVGDVADARRQLGAAKRLLIEAPGPLGRVLAAAAHAAIGVAEGDEPAAGGILRSCLADMPVRDQMFRSYWLDIVALLHVLVPETRPQWAGSELGPAHELGRELAQVFEAARRGDLDPLRDLSWPAPGTIQAHLPAPWVAELAVAGSAAGYRAAGALLDAAGPTSRRTVQMLARSSPDEHISRTAKKLLSAVPAPPSYHIRVAVVGPLELSRDGVVLTPPDLRRQRVRALLCYLVAQPRVRREEAATALWPDLDDGGRNLRVTLNYLQRVLQPDRAAGDAPYFVRQEGAWLRLAGEDRLEVDAWEIDARLKEGERAERSGTPANALAAYQAILPLWRGEPYADVPYADWADEVRHQMRTRFVAAALTAGRLHLAMGNADRARYAADQALAADPWAEAAHRLRVQASLALGDRGAARRAINRCRATLSELGLTPEPETLALERLVYD